MDTKKCPFCSEDVAIEAVKCKHCGEYIDIEVKRYMMNEFREVNYRSERDWSPGTAAILSFFIPGAGQVYKGEIFHGILYLIFTVLGYTLFVLPGIVIHCWVINNAYSGDPYR